MGVTAGSRFNAARRLQAIDRSLNYMLSAVSVSIIALTILPFIYVLDKDVERLVALFTIAASIAVLVLSNIHYGNRDLVIAEQLHRCALEINEIARRMDAEGEDVRGDILRRYSDEYSATLQKYSVNHDKIDFLEHKIYRRDEYESEYSGFLGGLRVASQSVQVLWAHNFVWIVGIPVLTLCAAIVVDAIKLI